MNNENSPKLTLQDETQETDPNTPTSLLYSTGTFNSMLDEAPTEIPQKDSENIIPRDISKPHETLVEIEEEDEYLPSFFTPTKINRPDFNLNQPLIIETKQDLFMRRNKRKSSAASFNIPFGMDTSDLYSPAETLLKGPQAPSEITDFQWSDVGLTLHKNFKKVIKGCYGHAKQGEIVAIVGPPKSGKTSLLKLIAQKMPVFVGKREAKLSINGTKFKKSYLKKSSVFVRDEDIFHEIYTAEELLAFASLLRVHGPKQHRENVVEGMLRDFELDNCKDLKLEEYSKYGIGIIGKRRLSIAMEMLDDPGIVFVDNALGDADGEINSDRLRQFQLLNILKKEAK